MPRERKLPASGSDRGLLSRHLKKAAVWKVLYLYARGTIDLTEVHERLAALRVRIEYGDVPQLLALALEEAKAVGA